MRIENEQEDIRHKGSGYTLSLSLSSCFGFVLLLACRLGIDVADLMVNRISFLLEKVFIMEVPFIGNCMGQSPFQENTITIRIR